MNQLKLLMQAPPTDLTMPAIRMKAVLKAHKFKKKKRKERRLEKLNAPLVHPSKETKAFSKNKTKGEWVYK